MVGRLLIDSRFRQAGQRSDDYVVELPKRLAAKTLALASTHVEFTAHTLSEGCDEFFWCEKRMVRRQDPATGAPVWQEERDPNTGKVLWREHLIKLPHMHLPAAHRIAEAMRIAIAAVRPGVGVGPAEPAAGEDPVNTISVTSPAAFRIRAYGSIANVLGIPSMPLSGFASVDGDTHSIESQAAAGGTYEVEFPRPVETDPVKVDPYLILSADVAGSLESPGTTGDGATSTILPGRQDIAQPLKCDMDRKEVDRIRITIKRVDGNKYDFRGYDHRLEFLIDGP